MSETVAIYAIVDPRDGKPFYVGQTVQPLKTRLSCHISYTTYAKGGVMDMKRTRLLEIIKCGYEPIIVGLTVVSADKASDAEIKHHRKLKKQGCDLIQADISAISNRRKHCSTPLPKRLARLVSRKAEKEGTTLGQVIERCLIEYTAPLKRKPSDQQLGA